MDDKTLKRRLDLSVKHMQHILDHNRAPFVADWGLLELLWRKPSRIRKDQLK